MTHFPYDRCILVQITRITSPRTPARRASTRETSVNLTLVRIAREIIDGEDRADHVFKKRIKMKFVATPFGQELKFSIFGPFSCSKKLCPPPKKKNFCGHDLFKVKELSFGWSYANLLHFDKNLYVRIDSFEWVIHSVKFLILSTFYE